ncbi:hypothetical protein NEAUS04_0118 [Nematocida ausubeli]|nr:hypothetical protein NEAUS06_1514 [Nematocida ausubeli]KAI5137973.1 hypothetical protein NEAUS07_2184 [Nematocida ausubeli]KAI5160744.1 hypothetical protein NEAUS04_0118 [Nematocida ausubeli]
MENRRPLRIRKKEEIFRIKEIQTAEKDDTKGSLPHVSDEEPHTDSEEYNSLNISTPEEEAKEEEIKKEEVERKLSFWSLYMQSSSFSVCVLVIGAVLGFLLHSYYRNLDNCINGLKDKIESQKERLLELESIFHSKNREIDVADYLEGARILYNITTDPYVEKKWFKSNVTGLSAEVAIDRVCDKHHCYSFNGSEGKLGIAFKNEKIIRKIGIMHPLYNDRTSAVKSFTVDCIMNDKHINMGEFEYEIPGDSFQQFSITPTKCTGMIFKIKSNHGKKQYTCIYKIYAFE